MTAYNPFLLSIFPPSGHSLNEGHSQGSITAFSLACCHGDHAGFQSFSSYLPL